MSLESFHPEIAFSPKTAPRTPESKKNKLNETFYVNGTWYEKNKPVLYRNLKSAEDKRYIVIGPTKEEVGGLILKEENSNRKFAISSKGMERITPIITDDEIEEDIPKEPNLTPAEKAKINAQLRDAFGNVPESSTTRSTKKTEAKRTPTDLAKVNTELRAAFGSNSIKPNLVPRPHSKEATPAEMRASEAKWAEIKRKDEILKNLRDLASPEPGEGINTKKVESVATTSPDLFPKRPLTDEQMRVPRPDKSALFSESPKIQETKTTRQAETVVPQNFPAVTEKIKKVSFFGRFGKSLTHTLAAAVTFLGLGGTVPTERAAELQESGVSDTLSRTVEIKKPTTTRTESSNHTEEVAPETEIQTPPSLRNTERPTHTNTPSLVRGMPPIPRVDREQRRRRADQTVETLREGELLDWWENNPNRLTTPPAVETPTRPPIPPSPNLGRR